MPAILPTGARQRWLHGSLAEAQRLLVPFDAAALQAAPLEPTDTAAPHRWRDEPDLFADEWWPSDPVTSHRKLARRRGVSRARPTETPGPVTPDLFASATVHVSACDVHDVPAGA